MKRGRYPQPPDLRAGGCFMCITSMVLEFSQFIDCEDCDEPFEGYWSDDSITEEDMTDAPVADQRCPGCGHVNRDVEYPGWMHKSDAG